MPKNKQTVIFAQYAEKSTITLMVPEKSALGLLVEIAKSANGDEKVFLEAKKIRQAYIGGIGGKERHKSTRKMPATYYFLIVVECQGLARAALFVEIVKKFCQAKRIKYEDVLSQCLFKKPEKPKSMILSEEDSALVE